MDTHMVKVKNNLIGKTFGRLTVLSRANDYVSPKGIHTAQWVCECSCSEHNRIVVRGSFLTQRTKPTQSCGCLQKEKVKATVGKYVKKSNQYSDVQRDEHGSYYIGLTSNTNKEFYIDAEHFEIVKDLCWCEHHPRPSFSTLVAYDPNTGKKNIKMHQLIGYGMYDHIDRNELNNRVYNLRPCTPQENSYNKSKRNDNTSGITGVSWNKRTNKWDANLQCNGIRWRKCFSDFEDAVKCRLEAEAKYFGDFAPQRHLFEKYGITEVM